MGRFLSKIKKLEDHVKMARAFQTNFEYYLFEMKTEINNLKDDINAIKNDVKIFNDGNLFYFAV